MLANVAFAVKGGEAKGINRDHPDATVGPADAARKLYRPLAASSPKHRLADEEQPRTVRRMDTEVLTVA